MAKHVPCTVFVDPNVETTLTIKPFAAGLATANVHPTGTTTASATGTNLTGSADVDADVDYSG